MRRRQPSPVAFLRRQAAHARRPAASRRSRSVSTKARCNDVNISPPLRAMQPYAATIGCEANLCCDLLQ
eukprot:scaffold24611_cov57-Phaeocystis_antarctica.AAC.4